MQHIRSLLTAVLLLISGLAAFSQSTPPHMNSETVHSFSIIGIAMRTTNEKGQSAKDIETIWTRFWNEHIGEKIAGKVSDDIYAVYKDYETDYTGAYTVVIGYRVASLQQIPTGFVGLMIETGPYKKFISKGKMPEAVYNTWLEIWGSKTLQRAYKTDFTVHGKKYYDGENAEVETFISVVE